jgi:hypothetical protein
MSEKRGQRPCPGFNWTGLFRGSISFMLIMAISGCAYLPLRYTMSIDTCADKIAISLARDLKDVREARMIRVGVPVDAVTYSKSDFGLAFQEFLTSAMAKRHAHVVDAHFQSGKKTSGKAEPTPLSREGSAYNESLEGIVLVSTYLVSESEVVITTRAIDTVTHEVIASAGAVLSRSDQVDDLLGRSKGVVVYEK